MNPKTDSCPPSRGFSEQRKCAEKVSPALNLAQAEVWRALLLARRNMFPGCGYSVKDLHDAAIRVMSWLE